MTFRRQLSFVSLFLLIAASASAKRREPPAPEGPMVHSVTITGNQAVTTAELENRITLKPGKPFKRDQLSFSHGLIESIYRDRGFYDVSVSSVVTVFSVNQMDITFGVTEGEIYRLGTIRMEGNRIVDDKIILRNLEVQSGDIFSQSKVFEGNRQLYMTGYFDAIDITYTTSTARTIDMTLKVRERATRFLKGGFGYGTRTKERLSLGVEDLNFLGNAWKADVTATWSGFATNPEHYETKKLEAVLTQPYFFGTRFEAQSNVRREWNRTKPYDKVSTSWQSSLGRRFGSAITASMRYRYEGTRVTRASPEAQTKGFTNISAVGPTYTYDNTNDPFLPSLGWRVNGTYEEGFRFFAGDVRFHKLESRVGRFDTLGRFTLFESIQAGMIRPHSTRTRDIIPIYERFFLGGANTVRGYSERSLGPRDESGALIGGNAFLVGNFELRHPIWKKLFGVTFFDAGQLYPTEPGRVWPHSSMDALSDFRYATGFGLRFHSPVGAIRLEAGYQLNPEGSTRFKNRVALHFSIGEIF